jgi:alpha-mannosidase
MNLLKLRIGRHLIKYAILPHQGSLSSTTVRAAYNFNHEMRLLTPLSSDTDHSIFNAIRLEGPPSLILDCIKRGEDDEDVSRGELVKRKGRSVILRIYDSLGGSTNFDIVWDRKVLPVQNVYGTNILEDDMFGRAFAPNGNRVRISLRAFEVTTIRLQI